MSVNKKLNFDLDTLDSNSAEFESERKALAKISGTNKQSRTGESGSHNTRNIIIVVDYCAIRQHTKCNVSICIQYASHSVF